jgi:hypothetical protein
LGVGLVQEWSTKWRGSRGKPLTKSYVVPAAMSPDGAVSKGHKMGPNAPFAAIVRAARAANRLFYARAL